MLIILSTCLSASLFTSTTYLLLVSLMLLSINLVVLYNIVFLFSRRSVSLLPGLSLFFNASLSLFLHSLLYLSRFIQICLLSFFLFPRLFFFPGYKLDFTELLISRKPVSPILQKDIWHVKFICCNTNPTISFINISFLSFTIPKAFSNVENNKVNKTGLLQLEL